MLYFIQKVLGAGRPEQTKIENSKSRDGVRATPSGECKPS